MARPGSREAERTVWLRAAIDDQEDAVSLVKNLFPGVPESAVKTRAGILYQWFLQTDRAAKVARREALSRMWETLPGEHESLDLSAQYEVTTKQNPLVLLEGLARRKRALKSDVDPSHVQRRSGRLGRSMLHCFLELS